MEYAMITKNTKGIRFILSRTLKSMIVQHRYANRIRRSKETDGVNNPVPALPESSPAVKPVV